MSQPYESPEVKAVRAAGRTPLPRTAETVPLHAPVSPAINSVLEEIIDADEVFIVGVLPWECSRQLIALQEERAANRQPRRKTVHYIIPERDAKNAGAAMGPRIQRWVAGLFGIRNWVVPHREQGADSDTLRVHLHRDDPDRVILIRRGERYTAVTLLYLPLDQPPRDGLLLVARYGPEETERIRDHVLTGLLPNTREWEIRQVRCVGPRYSDDGDPSSFDPRLSRVTSRREIQRGETEPAVVVAVCGQTADGPVVVLKRRHRSNSIDDFDVLSLISEHVIVDDLVGWMKRLTAPLDRDDRRAKDQLWVAAGRPTHITLGQQFFAEAAQRELFLSCGLNVDADRLQFRGYRLANRGDDTHLGFAVFRLDLIQEDFLDELEVIRTWDRSNKDQKDQKDLEEVPIRHLYTDPDRRLNRLLRIQRDWLIQNLFPEAASAGKA